MDVSAGSSLAASAGVINAQGSYSSVQASATTSAGVAIAGDDDLDAAALNGSSVTLGSNTTSALARGNAATNVLNYSAGANYGGTSGFGDPYASTIDGEVTLVARAGVLNTQINEREVFSLEHGFQLCGGAELAR